MNILEKSDLKPVKMVTGSSKVKTIFNIEIYILNLGKIQRRFFYLVFKFQKHLELPDALMSWTMKTYECICSYSQTNSCMEISGVEVT